MGVWIEIEMNVANILEDLSLPLWECGLKSANALYIPLAVLVTPLVGVWIEILRPPQKRESDAVTPLVGVWIEICGKRRGDQCGQSLPLWECGLKYSKSLQYALKMLSLPLWECGLK